MDMPLTDMPGIKDIKDTNIVSSSSKPYPSKLFIEITTKCNLSCQMCVKQDNAGIEEGELSEKTFKALVPALPHIESLVLNGIGEPLTHPRLEEYIKRAKALMQPESWVGFQTNGMLLDDARAKALVSAGLDRICISLDSISADSFKKIREGGNIEAVKRAFKALRTAAAERPESELSIGIEYVLMRENLAELPETIRWAARHGASYAIVTQLLPYKKPLAKQAVYDTNTFDAIDIYKGWKARAKSDGVDLLEYFDNFIKHYKTDYELKLEDYMKRMKDDAAGRGIALQTEKLLGRDEEWFQEVESVYDRVRDIAKEEGIDVTLPEIAPRNSRRCEFVETDSVFVSWSGDVHPCYFLWHRYSCYIGGWEKQVKPWVFGSLNDCDILEAWNDPDYRAFREKVVRYDFPFCFDCNFALCDYAQLEDFEHDCYIATVPCGACLWCTGLFHCLQ